MIAAHVLKKISRTKYGVRLIWKASKGAAKYRICRKTGNGKWVKLADVTSLKYVDTTVKKGVKYTYTVRCISANGKKATSGYNTRGLSIKYY